ncbi:hypothetical protein [Pseudomonas aeruginosa]|nr:hypothetical protein [Pseudomonas aeruginosa]
MNLKPQTLMVAIQCVAADDLKNAYEQALGQYSGLPPYDRLIEDPVS